MHRVVYLAQTFYELISHSRKASKQAIIEPSLEAAIGLASCLDPISFRHVVIAVVSLLMYGHGVFVETVISDGVWKEKAKLRCLEVSCQGKIRFAARNLDPLAYLAGSLLDQNITTTKHHIPIEKSSPLPHR